MCVILKIWPFLVATASALSFAVYHFHADHNCSFDVKHPASCRDMNVGIWSLASGFGLRKLWNLRKWDLADEVGPSVWSLEEYVFASTSQLTSKMETAASCSQWDYTAMRGWNPPNSEPKEVFPPFSCSCQVLDHSRLKPVKASRSSIFRVLVCFQDPAESLSSCCLSLK